MVLKSPPTADASPDKMSKLEQLVPERILKILGDPPTLPFESVDQFNDIFYEMVLHFSPRKSDITDFILVRGITDLHWEIGRLTHMSLAAKELSLPAAAVQLMKKQLVEQFDTDLHLEEHVTPIVRAAARGSAKHRDFFNDLAESAGVTQQMLQVVAYSKELNIISAIEDSIARLERRRDQLVRYYEERRRTAEAMSKLAGGMSRTATDIEVSATSAK
jgi:hypothetical protein